MSFFSQSIVLLILMKSIFWNTHISKQPNNAYTAAFEYIKMHTKGVRLVTIDTTVDLGISSFAEEVKNEWGLNEHRTDELLDSIDHTGGRHGAKIIGLKTSSPGNKDCRILYFSKMIDTILVAEVIPRRKIYVIKSYQKEAKKEDYNSLIHNNQAYYNQSDKYLFIFNRNLHLKKVFTQKIIYN